MSSQSGPIPERRPLTREERALAHWMLEHSSDEAAAFLPQLERARVVSRCPRGCASVNFEIDGLAKPSGGLHVLGDFLYGGEADLQGAFIFEQSGVLAGIEVWGLNVANPSILPMPDQLRPYDKAEMPEAP